MNVRHSNSNGFGPLGCPRRSPAAFADKTVFRLESIPHGPLSSGFTWAPLSSGPCTSQRRQPEQQRQVATAVTRRRPVISLSFSFLSKTAVRAAGSTARLLLFQEACHMAAKEPLYSVLEYVLMRRRSLRRLWPNCSVPFKPCGTNNRKRYCCILALHGRRRRRRRPVISVSFSLLSTGWPFKGGHLGHAPSNVIHIRSVDREIWVAPNSNFRTYG